MQYVKFVVFPVWTSSSSNKVHEVAHFFTLFELDNFFLCLFADGPGWQGSFANSTKFEVSSYPFQQDCGRS